MKKRSEQPVIHVNRLPGKVSADVITINIGKGKSEDTSVKIRNLVTVKKSSGQKIKEYFSLRYRLPYVDPDFVKLCFESSPEHTRCLRFVSNCIVGLGLNIEPVEKGLKDYLKDPEYLKLQSFRDEPVNEEAQSLVEVLTAWVLDYRSFGFGLIEIVKNKKNELAELYYFPSYEARIVYTEARDKLKLIDKLSVIQLLNNQEAAVFPLFTEDNFNDRAKERSVFLLKNINPFDRFYGFPEWYPATGKLALTRSIDEYNIKSFKNDLMMSFAIIVEGGELGEGQKDKVIDFLRANYKGVQNAQRALLLTSDNPDVKIRIEKVQKDGREASFILTQAAAVDSIVISHGVVGSLLGISKAGKLGNTTENRDLFQVMNETVIKPEQNKIADKLNMLVRVGLGITKFRLVPVELTFEKLTELIDFATKTVQSGLLDETEGRQVLGYDPREVNPDSIDEQIDKLAKQVKLIKTKLANV